MRAPQRKQGSPSRVWGSSPTVREGVISGTSMRDFDDNEFPLAYLITVRCHGTWLHGDRRGSMDRKHNLYGTPKIPRNKPFENSDRQQLKHPRIMLSAKQRAVVDIAIRDV